MKYLKSNFLVKCFIICFLLTVALFGQATKKDSIYVANWNLENLFDIMKDSVKNDKDFLPGSPKRWNYERFEHKLNNLAKVINYMNDGCAPDIIAFEEVENIYVVKKLIYTIKGSRDYIVCHRDSPDEHGLDVALIYDRNIFSIDSIAALHVELPDHHPTRDILHVVLIHKTNGEKFHFYVNHWPQKYADKVRSEKNFSAAAHVLRSSLDTLNQSAPNSNVIVLGDFNVDQDNNSIVNILKANVFNCKQDVFFQNELLNLSEKEFVWEKGTYLLNNKWMRFDQIMISISILNNKNVKYDCSSFNIIKPPFMIDPKSKNEGALPTYRGNKYIGGYSDHYPVAAKFYLKENK